MRTHDPSVVCLPCFLATESAAEELRASEAYERWLAIPAFLRARDHRCTDGLAEAMRQARIHAEIAKTYYHRWTTDWQNA